MTLGRFLSCALVVECCKLMVHAKGRIRRSCEHPVIAGEIFLPIQIEA